MQMRTIENLFHHYLVAFEQQRLASIAQCYQLPCTLYTPDKAVIITSDDAFKHEFVDIFTVLKTANIKQFIALNASYTYVSDTLALACVDWQFIGSNDEVFTDFTAFYHLALTDGSWRIFNVASQELSQSVALDTPFEISFHTSDKITE